MLCKQEVWLKVCNIISIFFTFFLLLSKCKPLITKLVGFFKITYFSSERKFFFVEKKFLKKSSFNPQRHFEDIDNIIEIFH